MYHCQCYSQLHLHTTISSAVLATAWQVLWLCRGISTVEGKDTTASLFCLDCTLSSILNICISNKSSENNMTSCLAHVQGAQHCILWFYDRFSTKHSLYITFIWRLHSISHAHSWSLALEAMPTMKQYLKHVFSSVSICMWLSENILHRT